ncbi:YEATS domain-containing protein 2 [Odontomachus brunneus]|uniref:YEATS domain-containing protein 2 n=1 Tax=Odontomachus brunneus TaxID=486640 RepID=UPI0013F2210A|nr:YEATS domain-containing protein 2 [Odontomachus brunneus]XP_032666204.1 YEATS domain-containing protein 2 [Odontomachus brunneus]
MSTFEESLNDQDPDYVSAVSNTQQKVYEENARNSTARKIVAIVKKEFSREINEKEKEILQIQERLNESFKILHYLRYVVITNFYSSKQCQLPQAAEASKQTRIHPAVKSLLGKSPKFLNYTEPAVPSTSTDPRFLSVNESPVQSGAKSSTIKAQNANKCNDKSSSTKKQPLSSDEEPRPCKIPRYVPPKSSVPESSAQPSRGDKHKVHKRVVIGNISKWIPREWRDDSETTHKWTIYVRGDKEATDVSTYISKVRFMLHPSYKPNDVVEVATYPFHLSRRGWGEFPLRVQLHFKNPLNKPSNIIHYLKLDRTYTGLQMLGSETLVDLWIYPANSHSCDESVSELVKLPVKNNVKIESGLIADDVVKLFKRFDRALPTSRLQDYTSEEIKVEKELLGPLTDSVFSEKPEDVKVKAVFDNAVREAVSGIPFPVNTEESHLDDIRFNIHHDHFYTREQYFKARRTVKDGNITIEHFPDNETAVAMSLPPININEEKSVDTMINGCYEFPSDPKPPTFANVLDTAESDSQILRESSEFPKSDDPEKNSWSLDANESSRATDSQNDEVPVGISDSTAKAATTTTTTTNGFCKPIDAMLDRLKNLQTAAGANNLHLQPLMISIPPLFTPSNGKRILLTKDKMLVSMNKEKSNDGDMKACERKNRPLTVAGDFAKLKLETIPQGTSILKKQLFKTKTNAKNTVTKKAAMLTLNDTNSLLLNMNYFEPALKIADSRDPQYNYSLSDAVKGISSSSLLSTGNREGTKSTDKDEKTTQRAKITLGKDKHKLQSKGQLYETVFQSIDRANITNTEALVRFIMRRLPMITQDARDPEYVRLHPYACYSEENFLAMSIGKQRALEWHRAKMVKSFLRKKLPQYDESRLWSVKEILVWTRLHGYTPNCSVFEASKVNTTSTSTKKLFDFSAFTCTEPVVFHKWLQANRQESSHRSTNDCVDEVDGIEIDIVAIDQNPCRGVIDRGKDVNVHSNSSAASSTLMPLELDKNLMPLHKFVCDTAQEIGIKIAPEEIVPGVVYCAASRVMMRVIECFVEDLTRSSWAKALERNSSDGCPKNITPDDVRNALASKEEFDIFTNEGLGSQQQRIEDST